MLTIIYDVLYFLLIFGLSIGIILGLFTIFIFLIKNGYIQQFSWYNALKMKFIQYITSSSTAGATNYMGMMQSMMDRFMPDDGGLSNFTLSENEQYLQGYITYGEREYMLLIPFDKSKAKFMRTKKIYTIKDQTKSNITCIPGVQYSITADMLNVDSIVLCDLKGNILNKFSGDQKIKLIKKSE